jgi:hypothetical protein
MLQLKLEYNEVVNSVIGGSSCHLWTVSSTPTRPCTATLRVALTVAEQSAARHSPATKQEDVRRIILTGGIFIWVREIVNVIPENASL